jgi:hypothetical protein
VGQETLEDTLRVTDCVHEYQRNARRVPLLEVGHPYTVAELNNPGEPVHDSSFRFDRVKKFNKDKC